MKKIISLLAIFSLLTVFSYTYALNVSGSESGMINDNVTIIGYFELNGMINGNVTIPQKSNFMLNGMVSGNVYIKKGGFLYLNGKVSGTVYNDGGFLKIKGIAGAVQTTNGGKSIIEKNAIIGGKRQK